MVPSLTPPNSRAVGPKVSPPILGVERSLTPRRPMSIKKCDILSHFFIARDAPPKPATIPLFDPPVRRYNRDPDFPYEGPMRISAPALLRPTPWVLLSLFALRDAPAAFEDVADCPLILACAGCHGDKGEGSGPFPAINSLDPQDVVSTLRSFRLGERPATVMQRIASGYTDPELLKIAQCLSGAPPR